MLHVKFTFNELQAIALTDKELIALLLAILDTSWSFFYTFQQNFIINFAIFKLFVKTLIKQKKPLEVSRAKFTTDTFDIQSRTKQANKPQRATSEFTFSFIESSESFPLPTFRDVPRRSCRPIVSWF